MIRNRYTEMKKMIYYLTAFLLLAPFCNLLAQRLPPSCGTPSSTHNFLKDIAPENFRVLAGTRIIKMFVVVYADDDGSNVAIDEETLKNELAFSNSIYNMGDICFSIVGIEIRNNTTLNNPGSSSVNYSTHRVTDAFTVFIVRSIGGASGNTGTFGWAPGIPASYMITRTGGFGVRRTFIHEMGHAFGLEHTFKGTGDDDDNPGCHELVNGSNGAICGDFVVDTPADPYERCGTTISGCTFPYTGTGCRDANNSAYSPQMNNFMSYWANYNCNRTVFTNGQYTRMQSTIDNNITLSSFLATDNLVVTNATISSGFVKKASKNLISVGNINSAGNYTVNGSVQAVFSSFQVEVKPGFTATPNSTGVVRILASNCQ